MSAAYAKYRAPTASGASLVEPARPGVGALLAENARRLASDSLVIAGRPLNELRVAARRELLATAQRYTKSLVGEPSASADGVPQASADGVVAESTPFILTGHQPGPCHPGVWWKNFALDALRRKTGAVGVHLIVDSDLAGAPAVNVPTGAGAELAYQSVAYDRPAAPLPFEERAIEAADVWESFGERATEALRPLVPDPLLPGFWPDAARCAGPLGEAWTAARVAQERRWGLANLEAPLSAVCSGQAMATLAAHLLSDAPRFRKVYNAALAQYRAAHGIRNRAHPAPGLECVDGWTEAPFWVWTAQRPTRRGVYVRRTGADITVSDRQDWTLSAPAPRLAEALAGLPAQGVKLRTRALTTTLFARLLLCDLFLHGIGGAKYDGVTDDLFRHYFGLEPPAYLTLSATLHLPIDDAALHGPIETEVDQRLRALWFHPERLLAGCDAAANAIAQKLRWVETPKTHANAAERHRGIHAANEAMRAMLSEEHARLVEQRELARSRDRARRIAQSREHPYFLFPEAALRETLASLADAIGV